MLVPVSLTASQMSAYRPRRSSPPTASRTTKTSPSDSCQSISTRRSTSAERQVAPPPPRRELLGRADREHSGRLRVLLRRGGGEAAAADLPVQDLAAQRDAALVLLQLDPLPDLVARTRRLHVGQPVARRLGDRAGEDLHRVAVVQRPVQRGDAAVDAGAVAVLADLGVDREGEVDGRGAFGEALHVAERREDEDLVLVEVDFEELEEFLR